MRQSDFKNRGLLIGFWRSSLNKIKVLPNTPENVPKAHETSLRPNGPLPRTIPNSEIVQKKENPPTQESANAAPQASPDEWAMRKFDLPRPKSLADLRAHLTPFKLGLLPRSGQEDGSLLNMARGYYRIGGSFLTIVLDRSSIRGGTVNIVSLQSKAG